MEQNYVDDHTAKQVSDTASDVSDTSSWNYLPDDFSDELPSTPKHMYLITAFIPVADAAGSNDFT